MEAGDTEPYKRRQQMAASTNISGFETRERKLPLIVRMRCSGKPELSDYLAVQPHRFMEHRVSGTQGRKRTKAGPACSTKLLVRELVVLGPA